MTLRPFADARVVVVDDNVPSAELVQALLARNGLPQVRSLNDPRELLARLTELAPQLVILDLHMPGLDGYAVLEELRRYSGPADLPVLVLTADTTRDATRRALELGASDFLTKPLDAAELVLRVRNLLQARALHVALVRRQRWLEASATLPADLLTGEFRTPLRRVCELAREAAEAGFAVLVGAAAGKDSAPGTGPWIGERSDEAAAAVADAFARERLRADAPTCLAGLADAVGPLVSVPLVGRDRLLGALVIARPVGAEGFTDAELGLAQGFASQAAVTVELAEARAEQARMLVLSDRHRIARDLHDQVIQRLFATGLRLQHVADRIGPGPLADQIGEHVTALDETITEIRSTIFGLRQPGTAGLDRLPARVDGLIEEITDVLDFAPDLRIAGKLDEVDEDLADDVVLAAREALTNVARHAQAHHVVVTVSTTGDGWLRLEVRDDGIGIGAAERRSGLINLYERARRHGGTCRVSPAPGGGTALEWTARLDSAALAAAGSGGAGAAPVGGQASNGTIVTGR